MILHKEDRGIIVHKLILASLLVSVGVCAEPRHVGYVLDKTGDWEIVNSQEAESVSIELGQALEPQTMIYAADGTPEGSQLTVALFNGMTYRCDVIAGQILCPCEDATSSKRCQKPLVLPNSFMETKSLWGRLQDVLRRFGKQPRRYVDTMSRSATFLTESVLLHQRGVTELAPLVSGFPSGAFHLYFVPRSIQQDAAIDPSQAIVVQWSSGTQGLAEGVRPGMYALHSSDPYSGATRPTRDNAWVLVVDHDDYPEIASEFGVARRLVTGWGERASPEAKQAFLRATLSLLAEEVGSNVQNSTR